MTVKVKHLYFCDICDVQSESNRGWTVVGDMHICFKHKITITTADGEIIINDQRGNDV